MFLYHQDNLLTVYLVWACCKHSLGLWAPAREMDEALSFPFYQPVSVAGVFCNHFHGFTHFFARPNYSSYLGPLSWVKSSPRCLQPSSDTLLFMEDFIYLPFDKCNHIRESDADSMSLDTPLICKESGVLHPTHKLA